MKPTKQWATRQAAEERRSARMYADKGFADIAKDERRHARKLSKFKGRR